MQMDRGQWHVRWFFWSLGIWDEFTDHNSTWHTEENGTNLCHFIRVTLVWVPLVFLINIFVYGAALATLTLVPVVLFGFTTYIAFIVATAIVIAVVWASKYSSYKRRHREREQRFRETYSADSSTAASSADATPMAAGAPGFFKTLWAFIVAGKQKICPMITFREPQGSMS